MYLKRLKKMEGGTDFSMFNDDEIARNFKEFIPTGSLAIDKRINGWPVGGISECASWEHVGKSTLLDQSMAQCQRMGGIAVLIDSEKAREQVWTELMGVDTSQLLVQQADTMELAFSGIEKVLSVQEAMINARKDPPPPMLIVWDSLGGTPTKAELAGQPDDQYMAVAAKVIKMNFRRLTQRLYKLRVALVFANHFYENIGGYGGLKTYGGSGIRYHTSVRVWLTSPEKIKFGDKEIGHVIRVKLKKNRIKGVKDPIDTALVYGAGVDNSYTLFEWGKDALNSDDQPWIIAPPKNAWQWLYPGGGVEPISFQRKFIGLGKVFTDNPRLYTKMAAQFLAD